MTRKADATSKPHVVIVGGGFAGVGCAHLLSDAHVPVTLLDRNNYHQFQPLLYQVATAQLAADDVATPLRTLFRKHQDITIKEAEVADVDVATRTVTTMGSQPNFFRTPGAEEHSLPLYSLLDAERLRSRILEVFDAAARDPRLIDQGALTFVIVGGGATGVEIAGALADFINHVLPAEYHDLAAQETRVHLVDHGNALLAPFSESAHEYAAKVLQRSGVRLQMGTAVKEITTDSVRLGDGTVLNTRCVVWAGGLKAAPLAASAGLVQGRGGRLTVEPDLAVDGQPNVFVLGDVSNLAGPDGVPYPQLGSVALQQGQWAAKNILADMAGKPRHAFHYHDKGIMAMIGRGAAVAEVGQKRHELHGAIAFASWLGVHAALMSGIRSRVDAFISWGWDNFSGNRSPGLIDHPDAASIVWKDPNATDADAPSPASTGPEAGVAPPPRASTDSAVPSA
jgi:NADH dehydrogenase